MTDTLTRYQPTTTSAEEVNQLIDLRDIPCGGCGFGPIAACVTTVRPKGSRTAHTLRVAYCCHCGRTSPAPLTIAEFPAGGWAAMAEALADVLPTVRVKGGRV